MLEGRMDSITKWAKNLGSFSLGLLIGTCYGAVVATLMSYAILEAL